MVNVYKATKNVKRSFLMPQANIRKLESGCNSGCIPNCQRNNPEINKATRLPKAAKLLAKICISKSNLLLHARFIPRWKYRFSSDQRSQAPLSSVSTGVGDQPGTLSDLAFLPPEVRGTRNSLVEPATCAGNIVRRNGNYLKY